MSNFRVSWIIKGVGYSEYVASLELACDCIDRVVSTNEFPAPLALRGAEFCGGNIIFKYKNFLTEIVFVLTEITEK
jgi:hypothetical protein